MPKLLLFIFPLLIGWEGKAQIRLENPSFEGNHQDATPPVGWFPCKEGSTPDILPGPWGVYLAPSDGDSYMGLITRDDGTWESVGQKLSRPMKARECYSFKVDLAHSNAYAGYSLPVKLRIWGCQTRCVKSQLLAESTYIKDTEWETYTFYFFPEKEMQYLIFEAYYANGVYIYYKGNILIDNCSTIDPCIRASLE